ncbi:FtsX-like permease family protein [Candidatus Uabimicrobium amorphum]|uniref:ABC transporter permease n=1 Tax=Uabimicrobium amorphum TaxID=2596890 RepID=A0A5S9IIP2_UABAM|nr:FtsX-like permease family protein [Candidatus Uabimicrobium amorphum]BBM82287.1 ABC transporter permease [Candidatus Uabimicrobium amorphum]
MFFAKMAWRNVWRNKTRTVITIAVMSFSYFFILTTLCLAIGYHDGIITNSVKAGSSHIQVHKNEFASLFNPHYYMEHSEDVLNVVKENPDVLDYTLRIKGAGLVNYTSKAQNVTIVGVNPTTEVKVSILHKKNTPESKGPIVSGEYLTDKDWQEGYPKDADGIAITSEEFRLPGILLGAKIAEKFNVRVGHKVVLTLQSLSGEIKQHLFRVNGIFKTLVPEYDKRTVFIHYKTAHKLFDYTAKSPLSKNDIDIPELVHHLQEPQNDKYRFLYEKLSKELRRQIQSKQQKNAEFVSDLKREFNKLLKSTFLPEEKIFSHIKIPQEMSSLDKNATQDLIQINRHILEQSFAEIKSRPQQGYFSEIAIICKNNDVIDAVAKDLKKSLQGKDFEILTWSQINPHLVEFITLDNIFMYFSIFVLIVVAAIGILIVVLMAIFERIYEFGIMRAMGMTPSRLIRLILIESIWIATISCVIGAIIAGPALYYLQVYGFDAALLAGGEEGASFFAISIDTVIYSKAEFIPIVLSWIFIMLLTVVVSLYPAIKATKIKVIEAIRFV